MAIIQRTPQQDKPGFYAQNPDLQARMNARLAEIIARGEAAEKNNFFAYKEDHDLLPASSVVNNHGIKKTKDHDLKDFKDHDLERPVKKNPDGRDHQIWGKWEELLKNDPALLLARSWGAHPGLLTKALNALGSTWLRQEIDFVSKKGDIQKRGAYLRLLVNKAIAKNPPSQAVEGQKAYRKDPLTAQPEQFETERHRATSSDQPRRPCLEQRASTATALGPHQSAPQTYPHSGTPRYSEGVPDSSPACQEYTQPACVESLPVPSFEPPSNPLPTGPVPDLTDHPHADAVVRGDLKVSHVGEQVFNLIHLMICQFFAVVGDAVRPSDRTLDCRCHNLKSDPPVLISAAISDKHVATSAALSAQYRAKAPRATRPTFLRGQVGFSRATSRRTPARSGESIKRITMASLSVSERCKCDPPIALAEQSQDSQRMHPRIKPKKPQNEVIISLFGVNFTRKARHGVPYLIFNDRNGPLATLSGLAYASTRLLVCSLAVLCRQTTRLIGRLPLQCGYRPYGEADPALQTLDAPRGPPIPHHLPNAFGIRATVAIGAL